MGLDGVELVMRVEETFEFSIPDEVAASIRTAGDLYDCVMARRFANSQEGCLSSVVFYKLRRGLMSVARAARSEIRLPSNLAAIIPRDRRNVWSTLQQALGLLLPKLVCPLWIVAIAVTIGLLLIVATAMFLAVKLSFAAWLPSMICAVCLISSILYLVTKPFAVAFRPEFATVGGLTVSILHLNHGSLADECHMVQAKEVWETVRGLIVQQLGVRPEDVTKEASFVEDLGMS